ncbi:hypothetical protein J1N35_025842 [Gossypium stocksii]|uniref:Uncharacterized protein n=1 Tax=Gossypium stocksii TaxID=47602 RepID=A0A9D3V714_9ROSI|nr:hypothetical protein J1N35_025842 [Gossypium stocksii]
MEALISINGDISRGPYAELFQRMNLRGWRLDKVNSTYLNQVEMEVQEELETMLHHDEVLWCQKAQCEWLDTTSFQTLMHFGFGFFGQSMGFQVVCLKTFQEDVVFSYGDPYLRIISLFFWRGLISCVSSGSSLGAFGRTVTCLSFKVFHGVLMRLLKFPIAGQVNTLQF